MKTRVHIEHVAIEGLALGLHDAPELERAIRAELERLFIERGTPAIMGSGAAPADGDTPSLRLTPSTQARDIGLQIGAGIYDAVGGSTS